MKRIILAVLMVACAIGVVPHVFAKPLAAHSSATSDGAPMNGPRSYAGKVLETMDSGGYTYVKLSTSEGEIWGAVLPAKVKVGDSVTIVDGVVMTDFEAKSLGRKFDRIVFGNLAGTAPSAPHGSARQETMAATTEVRKAEGADGRTIAEIWEQRAQLAGKSVAVRGHVVKFNGGIMGKNWLHLQDGTGTQAASNFDITVTSADEAKVGDVVVARGTVRLDKDFGAGYAYPVLVEDAAISK